MLKCDITSFTISFPNWSTNPVAGAPEQYQAIIDSAVDKVDTHHAAARSFGTLLHCNFDTTWIYKADITLM